MPYGPLREAPPPLPGAAARNVGLTYAAAAAATSLIRTPSGDPFARRVLTGKLPGGRGRRLPLAADCSSAREAGAPRPAARRCRTRGGRARPPPPPHDKRSHDSAAPITWPLPLSRIAAAKQSADMPTEVDDPRRPHPPAEPVDQRPDGMDREADVGEVRRVVAALPLATRPRPRAHAGRGSVRCARGCRSGPVDRQLLAEGEAQPGAAPPRPAAARSPGASAPSTVMVSVSPSACSRQVPAEKAISPSLPSKRAGSLWAKCLQSCAA